MQSQVHGNITPEAKLEDQKLAVCTNTLAAHGGSLCSLLLWEGGDQIRYGRQVEDEQVTRT